MNGHVDDAGRSLLSVGVRRRAGEPIVAVDAWVDTGFTGDLVLPQSTIDDLGLPKSGSVDAVLADGSQVEMQTYSCLLEWFGAARQLEVVANSGEFPLLGVGLLLGLELHVNYHTLEVTLLPPAS